MTTKHYKLCRSGKDRNFRTSGGLHRFDKEKVEWLSNYFLGESDETRRTFLRVVGDPGFQSGVGNVGIHQTAGVCDFSNTSVCSFRMMVNPYRLSPSL